VILKGEEREVGHQSDGRINSSISKIGTGQKAEDDDDDDDDDVMIIRINIINRLVL
jgi:hypothetical protein